MRRVSLFALACLIVSIPAFAQGGGVAAPAGPLTQGDRGVYEMVKGYITKAAEQVPENLYAFKATAEVRSFGQLVAHVADSNYMICSAAAAEKSPAGDIEKTKTAKADLGKALAASFAYCDKVWSATTDASGAKAVKMPFGPEMPRLSALSFNTAHDFEHYGNIVTYMRLNKMVPPSSQPQQPMR
jgi:uncharacterized damage-inducible protein DinB